MTLSKILARLIDKAIIPAVLLIASRLISVVIVSKYLGITFKITDHGFIVPNSYDYTKVNSYSVLFMTAMLVIGLFYVLIKSMFFHDSHIKPTITAKLFSIKAESLIQNSYEIYTQGAVWVSYSYMLLLVSGIMAMSNLMYKWVFYIITGVTLLTTLLFIFDVEEEIKIKKDKDVEYDTDKSLIELPGDL